VPSADVNGDGQVSRAEFNAWATQNVSQTAYLGTILGVSDGNLNTIYNALAFGNYNSINVAAVQQSLLQSISANGDAAAAALSVLHADVNGDGQISRAEFNAWANTNLNQTATLASILGVSGDNLDAIYNALGASGTDAVSAAQIQAGLLGSLTGTSSTTASTSSNILTTAQAQAQIANVQSQSLSQLISLNGLISSSSVHTASQMDAVVTAISILNQTLFNIGYGTDSSLWWIRLYASRINYNTAYTAIGLGQPAAFAMGGYHAGGVRLVGESGPELEFTGASYIASAAQTRALLGSSNQNTHDPSNDNRNAMMIANTVYSGSERIVEALHTEVALLRGDVARLTTALTIKNATPTRIAA
jgi:hypothetical protein